MAAVERIDRVDAAVARIREHAGNGLRVAAPLGLGKPNTLLNALYRAAAAEPGLFLHIYTALSLARPNPGSDLERRFVGPFSERHFGADYPDLDYIAARRRGALPPNVEISEFYLLSGSALFIDSVQQSYTCLNYTHVARDLSDLGINVLVQMIARRVEAGRVRYSLASNPDVSQDLIDAIAGRGRPRPYVVGVIHPDLPFVANDAEVGEDFFDLIVDDPAARHTLFALPREPVELAEYALGLHASTLVRDGGTLQIGIGALSDALVYALLLRHQRNADYRRSLDALGGAPPLADRIGGLAPFDVGLYGASEMVMDGFMRLAEGGVLKRRVFDDFALEQALAAGAIQETLDASAAECLYACGALPAHIGPVDLARLVRFGLLPEDTRLDGNALVLPDGARIEANLETPQARAALGRVFDGRRLRDGRYLRGAFYLGSKAFYAWLTGLTGEAFEGLSMTRVSDINQLYGGREALDALQRREGRFFNTCMMATALGAAVSDALADGRVVSGVGGQYNFVAMAHALHDGRSVLMLRAHRTGTASNILWNYGHTTIPRHLRDVFVTEYGVADLRGKSDQDCTLAMLGISDARWIDGLVSQAKAAGKLARDFQVPDRWRQNTPARLAELLGPLRGEDLYPRFPFGSDFTPDEQRLVSALQWLKGRSRGRVGQLGLAIQALFAGIRPQERPALARMGLASPASLAERFLARLVALGLARGSDKARCNTVENHGDREKTSE